MLCKPKEENVLRGCNQPCQVLQRNQNRDKNKEMTAGFGSMDDLGDFSAGEVSLYD